MQLMRLAEPFLVSRDDAVLTRQEIIGNRVSDEIFIFLVNIIAQQMVLMMVQRLMIIGNARLQQMVHRQIDAVFKVAFGKTVFYVLHHDVGSQMVMIDRRHLIDGMHIFIHHIDINLLEGYNMF
jgi:hypothetical protein